MMLGVAVGDEVDGGVSVGVIVEVLSRVVSGEEADDNADRDKAGGWAEAWAAWAPEGYAGVVPAARPHRSGIVSAVFLSAISWQERRYRWGLPQKSADKHGGDADQNDRNDQRNQEDQNRDAQKAQKAGSG